MSERDHWYIACSLEEIQRHRQISVELFDESYILFIRSDGTIICLKDRCLHRGYPLSKGKKIRSGFQCGYHGWTYSEDGSLIQVPSLTCSKKLPKGKIQEFPIKVHQNYIYVKISTAESMQELFRIPEFQSQGWQHIRLKNFFQASVTQCLENFLDVPHTAWVHPGIFRKERGEILKLKIHQSFGTVKTSYHGEKRNLGFFSRFLNPNNRELVHTDSFHSPNISCVYYSAGPRRQFYITSQAIPTGHGRTLVYTDLTYNYGVWSFWLRPLIRQYAQKIISQDQEVLKALWLNTQTLFQKHHSEADLPLNWIAAQRKIVEEGASQEVRQGQEREIEIRV